MQVNYRTWGKGFPPRPIKLEIPGWAGSHRKHETGCTPQPWHCIPFVEGSTYGLELIYPFEHETRVTNDGQIKFSGKFYDEDYDATEIPPPFSAFAPGHYGFTSSLDIEPPEGHVVRIEPHPRFFTDFTGNCPIAVPGHIQPWWCRIFFVVFKAPRLDETHIFQLGEPFAQILIVPKKINYEIQEMSQEKKLERIFIDNKIVALSKHLAKNVWYDHQGNQFDDKYKQLQAAYNKRGMNGILSLMEKIQSKCSFGGKIKTIGRYVKYEGVQNKKEHTPKKT
jgi:hypothetical protein